MTDWIIPLLIFIAILVFVFITFCKLQNFSKINWLIYLFLLMSWIVLSLFKNNPMIKSKKFFSDNWWILPVVLSLFQFTQVIVRIPLGKLSQKLKSRKQVFLIGMIFLLIGLIVVLSSNFSIWSIIIAFICSGVFGSLFGLDSQYFSENWNIKRAFISSGIIFTIPIASYNFGSSINHLFDINNIELFLLTLISAIIITLTIIAYVIFVKEDKATIYIDIKDPKSKVFAKKSWRDILLLSITSALVTFAINFTTHIIPIKFTYEKFIFIGIQLLGMLTTSFLLLKKFNARYIRIISQYSTLILLMVTGIVILTIGIGKNNILIKVLICLTNISFGIFIITMFGATLHFDHKHPELVLGIFLTFKSFATGGSQLSGDLINKSLSNSNIGTIIIIVMCIIIISSTLSSGLFILNKNKNIDNTIINAVLFEKNSNKIVISNKKIIK